MELANRILLLYAHPASHKSRINKRLIEEVKNIEGVTFHDLFNSYPDYHIDVKKEKELLLQHKVIIWQHPFYWYSSPALLKEWIDLVLEHGWAYGRKGNMLAGKKVMSVITAGGSEQVYTEGGYNGFTINQFLLPFSQTAKLCKMVYLPPFVVHGTHLLSEKDITDYAVKYKDILISLRDNLFSDEELLNNQYINHLID